MQPDLLSVNLADLLGPVRPADAVDTRQPRTVALLGEIVAAGARKRLPALDWTVTDSALLIGNYESESSRSCRDCVAAWCDVIAKLIDERPSGYEDGDLKAVWPLGSKKGNLVIGFGITVCLHAEVLTAEIVADRARALDVG